MNRLKFGLAVAASVLGAFAILNLVVGHEACHAGDTLGMVAATFGGVFSVVLGSVCFLKVME